MKKLVIFSLATIGFLYAGGKMVEYADTTPKKIPIADEWSGPYLGLQAGYIKGKGTINLSKYTKDNGFAAVFQGVTTNYDPFTLKPSGFIGGVFAGYNKQLQDSNAVVGIEAALNYTNIKKTKSPLSINQDNLDNQSYTLKQKWDNALYGKLGVITGEDKRLMPYILGGITTTKLYGGMTKDSVTKWDSKTLTGWTLGAGLEYKANQNWHIRLQYRYSDYGKATFKHDFSSGLNTEVYTAKVKKYSTNSIMAGISYHFK